MPLNEDTTTWIGFSPTAASFLRYGISQADYQILLNDAAFRAKNYILNTLKIPQSTLDDVVSGDRFQLAFQKLTASELIDVRVGVYENTLPFREFETTEDERVVQGKEDLNKWLDAGRKLKEEALAVLNDYIPESQRKAESYAFVYNWGF